MKTSWTLLEFIPVRWRTAEIAIEPNWIAGIEDNCEWNEPIGVLAAPNITTSLRNFFNQLPINIVNFNILMINTYLFY